MMNENTLRLWAYENTFAWAASNLGEPRRVWRPGRRDAPLAGVLDSVTGQLALAPGERLVVEGLGLYRVVLRVRGLQEGPLGTFAEVYLQRA